MNSLLRYLGLGFSTVLLTIVLSIGHWSLALIPPLSSSPSQMSVAQVSTDNLIEQGRHNYLEGRYADAIALWQQVLAAVNEQGDRFEQAKVLSNLALAYRQLGQWEQANQSIRDSLSILRALETLPVEGLRVLAQVLNTQGSLQLAQGQTRSALDSWEQATTVYQQAGDPIGVARSQMNQAIALRSLGFYRRALQQLDEVQLLLEEQSNSELLITFKRSLGETYRLIGDVEKSYELLNESLQLSEQLERPDEAAITKISLGNTLRMDAQHQEALAKRTKNPDIQAKADTLFQDALDQYRQAAEQSISSTIRVRAQLNQLDILIDRRDWTGTELLWQILPDQLENLSLSHSSIFATIQFIEHLDSIRRQAPCNALLCPSAQQIQELLTKTIQQAQALKDSLAESYVWGVLGHLYEQDNQISSALEVTERALTLPRYDQSSYRWHWQLGRLYKAQGEFEDAIANYDKAFRIVKTLRNDLLSLDSDIQFSFRDRIEHLYREYIDLLLPVTMNVTALNQQDQSGHEIAREVVDDLRVAELENFLACGLISNGDAEDRSTIDAVANADNRTAILYPIILSDRLEVLLKLPNRPIVRYPSSLTPQATIEQSLDEFRKSLERPYFSTNQGKPLAEQMYDWLIRPAEQKNWLDPEQIDTLVFVLDGKFRNISMAALYDSITNQFLVEKYAIATTFGDIEIPKASPSNQFRALIAGLSENPTSREFGPLEFGPLTYVPVEIANIRQILKHTRVLENNSFTRAAIESEIDSAPYNLVHLATHGEFGFSREETFLLAASPSAATSINSGEPQLDVDEINLNELDRLLRTRNLAPIDLLVLSACETATGDDREVLGIAGMAVQAGARTTLATLWSIDDSSTAVLMKRFYEGLVNQKLTKAEALRQAQRQLIGDTAYKPSDWAPYLLVGDWR